MKETHYTGKRKIEGPEKLVVIMMLIVMVIGLLISDVEIKLICAILFVIGGFILFMSISSRSKEILSTEEETLDENDGISDETDEKFMNKSNTPNLSRPKTFENENEFFIVKSIPGEKNNIKSTHIPIKTTKETTKTENNGYKYFDIDYEKIVEEKDPKDEFYNLLQQVLSIINDVLYANTVAFFWVNQNKNQIVFDAGLTSSSQFILKRKDTLQIGGNLIGQIAISGMPEIISNVNVDGEKDLLGYYQSNEFIKCAVGVPVLYNDNVVGVIIVDSKDDDAYGKETVTQLTPFSNLISLLIKNNTEKFDYYLDSMILNKIEMLNQNLKSNFNLPSLMKNSLEVVTQIFDWEFATFCFFDIVRGDWRVKMINKKDENDNYVNVNLSIDPNNSLIGTIIKESRFIIVSDLSKLQMPRFSRDENINRVGSFLAIPIFASSKIFGAITLESKKTNQFSFEDAELLNKFCSSVSNSLEIAKLKEYISDKITIDNTTNISNKSYFSKMLSSQLDWIKDFACSGVCLTISVDKYDDLKGRFGQEGLNNIFINIVQILESNLASYNLLGKINENCFGIFLLNNNLEEGKLFAEKIRKTIASNIINFNNKSFSVTVSIGIIEVSKFQKVEEVLENAEKSLSKAISEGGNRVKLS